MFAFQQPEIQYVKLICILSVRDVHSIEREMAIFMFTSTFLWVLHFRQHVVISVNLEKVLK